MKKNNIFILTGIGIIIICAGLVLSGSIKQAIIGGEVKISGENVGGGVVLIINDGKEPQKTFETDFKEGLKAFDLLKKGTEELGLILKTKEYDMGIFIEAIGGRENGQDGKYWMYYVNGEMPMVAADKEALKPGDKVEFKFEKSSF